MSKHQLNYQDRLTASTNNEYGSMHNEISLKENGKYFIELQYVEWMCRYSGTFEMNNDTLIIDKEIISQSDSIFNDIYIFNADKRYLVPIIKNELSADTSNWLVVGQNNYTGRK